MFLCPRTILLTIYTPSTWRVLSCMAGLFALHDRELNGGRGGASSAVTRGTP